MSTSDSIPDERRPIYTDDPINTTHSRTTDEIGSGSGPGPGPSSPYQSSNPNHPNVGGPSTRYYPSSLASSSSMALPPYLSQPQLNYHPEVVQEQDQDLEIEIAIDEIAASSPPIDPLRSTHHRSPSSFSAHRYGTKNQGLGESFDDPKDQHDTDTDQDGQSFDDYDWDTDDDLEGDVRFDDLNDSHQQKGHHRRRTLARRLSPYNIIKCLITTFIGNILLAIALIVPPVILRFGGFYHEQDQAGRRFIYQNVTAWTSWAGYNLLSSWALHFLVELAPRCLILVVGMIWGDVHEGIKTKVETFHTGKAWLKTILYAAMLWGSWVIIFEGIFNLHRSSSSEQSRAPYTDTVAIVVELLFFFCLVLSIERLILLSISMSFHRVAYSDRIQKVTRALTVIDILQDYRPKTSKPSPLSGIGTGNNRTAQPSGDMMNFRALSTALTSPMMKRTDQEITLEPEPRRRRWWQRNKPADLRKDLEMDEKTKDESTSPRYGSPLVAGSDDPYPPRGGGGTFRPPGPKRRGSETTTLAAIARKGANAAKIARAAMKDPVSVVGKKSGLALDINNPAEAKKLARRIFFGFRADPNRKYLIPSDFYPAFPTEKLAREAFMIFDTDGNGDISRSEVKNEIFRVYKERRALSQSLQDVGHAIGRLDGIMLGLAAIVFLFVSLSVVGIDFSKTLTSIYTIGIAAAFVFKGTAANVFDSIVMVFCTHPFDTGDRIIMDNAGVEEVLVVKQMGLLVTVFTRWDGTEWFAPNSLIGQKFIINLRRSFNQFENATVQFGWDTPLWKIDELEERINYWLQTDEQRRFEPGTAAVIQKLVNQQYIEITFGMVHRENWQDWGGRWNRRTAFHAAINYYSRELGITFYGSEQPVEMVGSNWDQVFDKGLSGGLMMEDGMEGDGDVDEPVERPDEPVKFAEGDESMPSRLPEVFGFSPPPLSGTGMRKRKKLSKKKAMFGDA